MTLVRELSGIIIINYFIPNLEHRRTILLRSYYIIDTFCDKTIVMSTLFYCIIVKHYGPMSDLAVDA